MLQYIWETDCQDCTTSVEPQVKGQDKISLNEDKIRYDRRALGKNRGHRISKPAGPIPLPQPNHERERSIRGARNFSKSRI